MSRNWSGRLPSRNRDGEFNQVQKQLQSRLKMLEQQLSQTAAPTKSVLPAWLVEQLQGQGIPFTSEGRPDLTSTTGLKHA